MQTRYLMNYFCLLQLQMERNNGSRGFLPIKRMEQLYAQCSCIYIKETFVLLSIFDVNDTRMPAGIMCRNYLSKESDFCSVQEEKLCLKGSISCHSLHDFSLHVFRFSFTLLNIAGSEKTLSMTQFTFYKAHTKLWKEWFEACPTGPPDDDADKVTAAAMLLMMMLLMMLWLVMGASGVTCSWQEWHVGHVRHASPLMLHVACYDVFHSPVLMQSATGPGELHYKWPIKPVIFPCSILMALIKLSFPMHHSALLFTLLVGLDW